MASIDLNIIDRGTPATDWKAQNTCIQAADLDKVAESRADSSEALNSLPTPFARFFLVQEAFRRVTEEKKDKSKIAGQAYQQLVSDCLDVFELLYNQKYHNGVWNGGKKIVIKEWDRAQHMKELQQEVSILYNALNSSYGQDVNEPKLFFVVIEENGKQNLLAASSPMTGFVTPPDMDRYEDNRQVKHNVEVYDGIKLKRKDKGFYFNDVLMFGERDADFKNYMFNLFSSGAVDGRFARLRDYIRSFKDDKNITDNYSARQKPVLTENNSALVVNGLSIMYNDETDINSFFTQKIIKLPYRLNTENYVGLAYENDHDERDYDYLVPLKSEALAFLTEAGSRCICQVRKNDVQIKLTVGGKTYTKTYDNDGHTVDFKHNRHDMNVGLFPNILSVNEAENDYFKLVLCVVDNNDNYHDLTVDDVRLSFYRRNSNGDYYKIEEADSSHGAQNGVKKAVVRSKQSIDTTNNAESPYGTKYYELFNTAFDAIEINIGKTGASGLLQPLWRKAQRTNDGYTYAIDLGTSNTFISRTSNGDNNMPEMFSMVGPMVSYMHESKKSMAFSTVANIEKSMSGSVRTAMQTEFVPPYVDGVEYRFPIRTAVCRLKTTVSRPSLFDNHNIAFFYERMLENKFHESVTDVKWKDDEDCIRMFIRELLLIIKCDVLERNGTLGQTHIVWFRPLSFSGSLRRTYEKIWTDTVESVLFSRNVRCYTESEAPYYYFKKMDMITNADSVAVIDIGGGSTDCIYFSENKPNVASSIHFGCDVMWGNGHKGFDNVRENGIYKHYINNIDWKGNEELRSLEAEMNAKKSVTTENFVNFWLSSQRNNNIIDRLHDDFMPLFVYHLTAIIYYIARSYRYKGIEAPRTVMFSGNGSRYIDNFITSDASVISSIITHIFNNVYGKEFEPIYVVLPEKRKESTCYGGLYRPDDATDAPAFVYHGVDSDYENVGEMNSDRTLQPRLLECYDEMNRIYGEVLDYLKKNDIIDQTFNIANFKAEAAKGYKDNLGNHYRSDVKERFADEDFTNDAVFFIPVVDKIFEMTKIYEQELK